MDQLSETLPIRLKPSKRSQIFNLFFFGFFFLFALLWMIRTSQSGITVRFNDVVVTDPYWRSMYPLLGIPFALIGTCGIAVAVLKMRPNSPYYYLELTADGLTLSTLFTKQSFAWRDLPPFQSLRSVDRSDDSKTITYYAAAMEGPADSRNRREILLIEASEYGTKNNEQSAEELAARLNRLRATALSLTGADVRTLPSQTAAARPHQYMTPTQSNPEQ